MAEEVDASSLPEPGPPRESAKLPIEVEDERREDSPSRVVDNAVYRSERAGPRPSTTETQGGSGRHGGVARTNPAAHRGSGPAEQLMSSADSIARSEAEHGEEPATEPEHVTGGQQERRTGTQEHHLHWGDEEGAPLEMVKVEPPHEPPAASDDRDAQRRGARTLREHDSYFNCPVGRARFHLRWYVMTQQVGLVLPALCRPLALCVDMWILNWILTAEGRSRESPGLSRPARCEQVFTCSIRMLPVRAFARRPNPRRLRGKQTHVARHLPSESRVCVCRQGRLARLPVQPRLEQLVAE